MADELISFGWTSAEGRLKFETLGPNERWNVMFSATDARRVPALIQGIRDALGEGESAREVMAACKAAYRDQLGELFETRLRALGLTRKDFEKKGRAYFGDAGLADLSEEFAKKDLGIDLLVAGFDEKHDMLLFEVTGRGEVLGQYGFDFRTIGSGSDIVLAVLNPLTGFCDGDDLHQVVYTLCAAKFAAESDDKVGRQTMVLCIDESGDSKLMGGHDIDDLRMWWQYKGKPPFPEEARSVIKASLLSYGERMSQKLEAYLEAENAKRALDKNET